MLMTFKRALNKFRSRRILKSLQYRSGLFGASHETVGTGYNRSWIRDNIYEALGLENVSDYRSVIKTYHALFDVLKKHEYKIDYAIEKKPEQAYQYIHARYCPFSFSEIHEEWGNKQNDAVGAFLFKVAHLKEKGLKVLRNKDDLRIIQKLVLYLNSIEYWHDHDNGMWEENEEVHASSVGACLAGLIAVSSFVQVPMHMITLGRQALNELLPCESITKEADLALLSLIYPYNIVNQSQRDAIIENVEKNLVRDMGVIRYPKDKYYSFKDKEAEWTFGFPWLAKIFKDIGNEKKFEHYMKKTHDCMNANGELPELYYGGTKEHNENSPLGWSVAMYLCALGGQ